MALSYAWPTPHEFTTGEVFSKTIGDGLSNAVGYLKGLGSAPTIENSMSVVKSLDGGHTFDVQNSNTGTGALAAVTVRNDTGSTDALRLFCYGKSWTTSGIQVQDGANVEAGANLSGGLSLGAAHASGVVRIFTAGTGSANERVRVDSAGAVFIGDNANASQTIGLTINQAANDDEIFSLKSSDVAHGVTGLAETDTFLSIRKALGDSGGAEVRAFTEAQAAYYIWGIETSNDTAAASVSSLATIVLNASKKSGTSTTSVGANGKLVAFRNDSVTTHLFDAEGDSFEDGTGWTAYDDHDDIALLDLVNTVFVKAAASGDAIKSEFWAWVHDNARKLQDLKLVSFNSDGHHFINRSKMQELTVGALRQIGRDMSDLRQTVAQLQTAIGAVRLLPEAS